MKKRTVFFDRDGIANRAPTEEQYYILSPEDLIVEPAFIEALKVVEAKGVEAIIITSQKCVGKGLITEAQLDRIHQVLFDAVAAAGTKLKAIYFCPHPEGHPDQKPNPGMLLRAGEEHELDLTTSWMIGDQPRDVETGQAAGCATTVLVNAEKQSDADFHLTDLRQLPRLLREKL